jgi:hypothetical protein
LDENISTPYPHKYKTSLCKNWESTGSCKFLKGCSFAHGLKELQEKGELIATSLPLVPAVKALPVKAASESKPKTENLRKSDCGLSSVSTDQTELKELCSRNNSDFDERNEILAITG